MPRNLLPGVRGFDETVVRLGVELPIREYRRLDRRLSHLVLHEEAEIPARLLLVLHPGKDQRIDSSCGSVS